MPVSLKDKMKTFSPERLERIHQHAGRIVDESRLTALREAAGLTQVELAAALSTSQANVSQIEKQRDPKVSTLRKFVEALGGTLEVVAKLPNHEPLDISSFAGSDLGELRRPTVKRAAKHSKHGSGGGRLAGTMTRKVTAKKG